VHSWSVVNFIDIGNVSSIKHGYFGTLEGIIILLFIPVNPRVDVGRDRTMPTELSIAVAMPMTILVMGIAKLKLVLSVCRNNPVMAFARVAVWSRLWMRICSLAVRGLNASST
jgi:hypothetical protein